MFYLCVLADLVGVAGQRQVGAAGGGDARQGVEKAREVVETIPLKAEPTKKRKVLIYGISWGPHRNGMLTAVETLKMIGEETGAYESVISLDLANFEPEALVQFDAVIFPNSTGDVFVRPVAKEAFKELPEKAAPVLHILHEVVGKTMRIRQLFLLLFM